MGAIFRGHTEPDTWQPLFDINTVICTHYGLCVCTHMCTYTCVHMHVHVCGGQRTTSGVILQVLPTLSFETGLSVTWNPQSRLGWPTRKQAPTSCLPLSPLYWDYVTMPNFVKKMWVLEFELRSLCSHSEHSSGSAIPQTQHRYL